MGWRIKLIVFALGLMFLVVVLRNVRQNKFRPVYAVLWIGVSVFLLSVALLESVYRWLAVSVIGLIDARHIIYIGIIGFLLLYNLYLTTMVSRMSNQIRQLISALAILKAQVFDQRLSGNHDNAGRESIFGSDSCRKEGLETK